ncbi:MAG: FAD-binding oxidoreductase [Gammaproteobacteria bacterium]
MSVSGVTGSTTLDLSDADVEIFDNPVDLTAYRRDASLVDPGTPDMVARPNNVDELQRILRRANEAKTAVYLRGAGSMYAGGVNPHQSGLVLDMTGLDRIIDIDLERGVVIVEPGVRFGALLKALKPHGMTIGVVPLTGPTATVGGAASSHALGTGSVRYQSFADEVVGLEAVLADGTIIRTGSAVLENAGYFARHAFGPDVTGLFLGSDATLGVISKLALWLHPIPAARKTICLGFPSPEQGASCIARLQTRELLGDVWYASIYDSMAIQGRMSAAFPDKPVENWPKFALGLDIGGDERQIDAAANVIRDCAAEFKGGDFAAFNEVFYRKLRYDETFWYSFAGYFTRSRCGLLMTSLPADRIPAFYNVINEMRERFEDFVWAPGAIMCRRGLHGGVIAFYDEQTQWAAMQAAFKRCTQALLDAGCVPYKSGKVWAEHIKALDPHHALLTQIKAALDINGIMSPGNLGL